MIDVGKDLQSAYDYGYRQGVKDTLDDIHKTLERSLRERFAHLTKTEPSNSEKPNNCEPQKRCDECIHFDRPYTKRDKDGMLIIGVECDGMDEPCDKWTDEPQTMLNDGTLVINVEDATKVSRVLVGDDKNRGDLYYPDDEDEPQTDCPWK